MNVSKIIIPAAGFGTRFLPITKSVPKELLPLIDKPALQNVVEEGIAAGIDSFYLIVNKEKKAIKHYFSPNPTLENKLSKNQQQRLTSINDIVKKASFFYVNQPEMRGLGHAILMAKNKIKNEMFGVILPDDIMVADTPAIAQLIAIAQQYNATVVAVTEVAGDEISAYGSIKPGQALSEDVIEITDIIEKPTPDKAFSNLGIIGRYVFTPAIFDAIEAIAPQAQGEIQLTDAITYLAQQGHRVLAYKVKGKRFDIGRPVGWLEANIYFGLQSKEYGATLQKSLRLYI